MCVEPIYNVGMTLDAIMMMRFPSDVKAALAKAAKAEHRSMSNLTLAVMSAWLVDQGYMRPTKPASRKGK